MPKSQRLTIKSHNIEFLKILASQMDLTDLSEVVNYLLIDIRGLGYTFGNKPAPTPQATPIGFDCRTFEPTFIPHYFDNDRNYQEIDPIIARMSQLIEDF